MNTIPHWLACKPLADANLPAWLEDVRMDAQSGPIQIGHAVPVLDHGFVRYVDHMGSDDRICEAARVSYHTKSKGAESDQKLINYLWKNKHTSPFEMAKVTLNIKLPVFVMRQYVRHRMQNLNEVSARYTELPNEFYIPKMWRAQDEKNKQSSSGAINPPITYGGHEADQWTYETTTQAVNCFCDEAYCLYQSMLAIGIAREMARMVLPVNIYTEIYCCWDLKNLLHFITLREDGHAQFEIQEYARAIKSMLVIIFPMTMAAYESSVSKPT